MQKNSEHKVNLSEDQLSNGTDKVGMDTTSVKHQKDNRDSATEESSMISNLPLLFANGHPTSLEKITMAQLERFISFMVHCSLGHDTTTIINKPQWWPQDIKFSNPLIRPKKINDKWMANLKKLVFRCYTYHRSEYLLRFCSYLAQYPCEELEYVNNWDSTTSLYHKTSTKLLVTFRNENMNYDKKIDNPRKILLFHNASSSGYGNKSNQQNTPMMVQPPCDDIYLCDNCDAEFVGLAKMKEHEKVCGEQDHAGSGSRSSTPDLSAIEPESQNKFLKYFGLLSNETEVESTSANTSKPENNIARRTSRRVRGSIKFARCATIPFSSPAGLVLAKQSKAMTEETQKERLDRIERHVIAPVLSSSCRPKWLDVEPDYDRWIVTHKQNRDKSSKSYVHRYKFVKFGGRNKLELNIKSQLLYVMCRPIYVVLTRLSQEQIDILKQDPSRYKYSQRDSGRVMLMRKVGPACKTKRLREKPHAQNTSVLLRRKVSIGGELNPIVVEDDEADISKLRSSSKEDCTVPIIVRSPIDKKLTTSIAEKKSCSTDSIMLIDLCSSDEEEDRSSLLLHCDEEEDRSSLLLHCDENRDPMDSTETSILTMSLLRRMTNKHYAKSYVHSMASSADRLSSNVLNNGRNDNCSNKSRTSVLNEYAHLSPILRSAP